MQKSLYIFFEFLSTIFPFLFLPVPVFRSIRVFARARLGAGLWKGSDLAPYRRLTTVPAVPVAVLPVVACVAPLVSLEFLNKVGRIKTQ